MNQREPDPADISDALPFGLVRVQASRVTRVNAYVRQQLRLSAQGLLEQAPALRTLMDAPAGGPRLPVEIQSVRYIGQVLAGPDGSRLLLLYPPSFFSRPGDAIDALGAPGELAEIFHNSYDGIFVTDGQGVALWLNEGCERNYGIRAQDVIGRNVCELEDAGVISPVIAPRVIATKKRITAMQTTRSGKKVVVTGIPLFDDYGNVRRVILNSRDTTELVRLQEQLAQAHEKLEKFESEIEHLRQETADMIDGIVVQSPRMRAVVELTVRVSKVDTTVLVHGESGVGKEIIGRLIHRTSARCTGPLIKVNCGAIPRELIESELFGYEGGAFTSARRQGKIGMFELAHNGTLFLDEIGELPLDMQAKLLQVLQDRTITRVGGTKPIPVDFRVVAATNRLLGEMVNQKLFRKDLYFRLNVVSVLVPPLRERVEDIVPLIRHFLNEFNRQYGISRQLSESALAELLRYRWPGNVRELRNVIERLVVTTVGDVIEQVDLIDPFDAASGDDPAEAEPGDLKLRVARYEERLLREALKKHGSTRAVAKALDISQSSVVRKLKG